MAPSASEAPASAPTAAPQAAAPSASDLLPTEPPAPGSACRVGGVGGGAGGPKGSGSTVGGADGGGGGGGVCARTCHADGVGGGDGGGGAPPSAAQSAQDAAPSLAPWASPRSRVRTADEPASSSMGTCLPRSAAAICMHAHEVSDATAAVQAPRGASVEAFASARTPTASTVRPPPMRVPPILARPLCHRECLRLPGSVATPRVGTDLVSLQDANDRSSLKSAVTSASPPPPSDSSPPTSEDAQWAMPPRPLMAPSGAVRAWEPTGPAAVAPPPTVAHVSALHTLDPLDATEEEAAPASTVQIL